MTKDSHATVTTATSDDLATVTTSSTTKNESFSSIIHSARTPQQQNESNFKTPCLGNYSSRPSFLTERILEDDSSDENMMVTTSASSLSTESENKQNNEGKPGGASQVKSQQENEGTIRQDKKNEMKRKSKKGPKNMEARRKRMSRTVAVLNEEWPKRCTEDTTKRNGKKITAIVILHYSTKR